MTFLLAHLNVSESLYGLTVTIAGIGAIIGGVLATALTKTISVMSYLKGGFALSMLSYLSFIYPVKRAVNYIVFKVSFSHRQFDRYDFLHVVNPLIESPFLQLFENKELFVYDWGKVWDVRGDLDVEYTKAQCHY